MNRHRALVSSMLIAIAIVTGLAWWDEQREAEAALQDLQSEQSTLSRSVANTLKARLAAIADEAALIGEHGPAAAVGDRYWPVVVRPASSAPGPKSSDPQRFLLAVPLSDGRIVDIGVRLGDLVDQERQVGRPGDLLLLIAPPNDTRFYALDGNAFVSPVLREAFERGTSTLRLTRPEAAQIGLPSRTSMAGLAHLDTGDLGHWGVIAVASAARERDREKRARWRLVLSVLVASGLVLAFGGLALRRQRKEFELERELAVNEVQRTRDRQLLDAERVATMGTFAMGIAHEVATPLGVIVGRAEQLLGKVKDDERATRSARAILTQADRIQHIVRRFLDMARGGPPTLQLVDPASVLRLAVEAVQHRFAKAKVRLDTNAPSTMAAIECDRDLLEQALVNLLLNACEASAEGGRVEISAFSDAEQVAFVVSDEGVGISVENARRATEPFFTTKPRGTGTGLGLAIASEIVKGHRGKLSLSPNTGRGTRARIEIPTASADRRGEG